MSFGIGRTLMTLQSIEDETQGELELRPAVAPAQRVLGVVVELGGDHRREVRERFRHGGELRLDVQAKLLHFLGERRFRRIGSNREIRVDVRVIGLTNRNLQAMVQEGTFRGDLFFRLNVFPVTVPPLRERPEDILPLARHFLGTLQARVGRRVAGFEREAERLLLAYPWPGNVRELGNVLERALVLERGSEVSVRSLMLDWSPVARGAVVQPPAAASLPAGVVPLEEMEREMVGRAMRATGDNVTRSAEMLGITRDQLRYRLKRLGLRPADGDE